jgi:RNA polymerase-interacting CarD/CdnL/TRCF family regulator
MRSLCPDVIAHAMKTIRADQGKKRAMWSFRAQEYEQRSTLAILIAIARSGADLHHR